MKYKWACHNIGGLYWGRPGIRSSCECEGYRMGTVQHRCIPIGSSGAYLGLYFLYELCKEYIYIYIYIFFLSFKNASG